MRRGARVAESGGLENRCTLTGTVGSNPTLSVRKDRETRGRGEVEKILPVPLSPCLILERSPNGMAPRWKRGGSKGLCGFESRSLRQFLNLELQI